MQTPCRGGRQLRGRCCAKPNYWDVFSSRRVFPRHVSKEIRKLKMLPNAQFLLYFKTAFALPDLRLFPSALGPGRLCHAFATPDMLRNALKMSKGQKILLLLLLGPSVGVLVSSTPAHGHHSVLYAQGHTRSLQERWCCSSASWQLAVMGWLCLELASLGGVFCFFFYDVVNFCHDFVLQSSTRVRMLRSV